MKKYSIKREYGVLKFIFLCLVCGAIVGALIFFFKLTASSVIALSGRIYSYSRENLIFALLVPVFAVALGVASSLILKYAPDGKGGGIPTAISALRGFVSFSWVKSLLSMFTSAMITFLVGVPLGNEGPSVQMGTAIGRGCVRMVGKKHVTWDRYIMTGGACAGFAAATGAPISGIFFALEEAHRRFSPTIFTASAMTAVTAGGVMKILCEVTNTPFFIFSFHTAEALPVRYGWIAAVVGVVCGSLAVMLTKLYRATRKLLQINLKRIPFMFKVCTIFFVVSILGMLSDELIGSGHHLVEDLVESQGVWYLLLIYLVVRACILLFSNNVGITGGLFVPTLAFGAIAGSLVGTALTSLGLLPSEYYSVTVIIGIASVLASFSRTPVMAIAFSLEALGAVNNVLPVILGVTAAFVLVERYESLPFTDVVIEARTEDANKGKEAVFMEAEFTVAEGAFIVDKEIRDILWPSGCIVTSVHKSKKIDHKHGGIIDVGDKLHFHFKSYDLDNTLNLIKSYVGEQPSESDITSLNNDADDDVPEF